MSAFRIHGIGQPRADAPIGRLRMHMLKQVNRRNVLFLLFSIVSLLLFYASLSDLLRSSLRSEYYSHIAFIPLISGYLIYLRRKAVFSKLEYSWKAGIPLIACGMALYGIAMSLEDRLNPNDYHAVVTSSVVLLWAGGFSLFYGVRALKSAAFPLVFLGFMIPIPSLVMEKIILMLQMGSAEAAHGFFKLTGMPFAREGFVFTLPTLSIEVAKQCSGIRSSLALFITSVLAGNLLLRTGWRRIVLAASVFPITIVKNGLRIVMLSVLGVYVDERILTHSILHSNGGVLFFLLALSLLGTVLWLLRKTERRIFPDDAGQSG